MILLCTLVGFAFIQFEEQFEEDDFPFGEVSPVGWTIRLLQLSFLPNIELAVFAIILISEYLRSHIGEKRPGDWMAGSSKLAFLAQFIKTTLFCRVVFLLSGPVPTVGNGSVKVFRAKPVPSTSFKEIFFNVRRLVVMREIIKVGWLEQKLLIQGDL